MSLSARLTSAKSVVAVLKRFPVDTNRIYPSFSLPQIAFYESNDPSSLPSTEVLNYRQHSFESLVSNANRNSFPVSARLLTPSGQPDYYEMISREACGQNHKSSFIRGFFDTAFGWWK